MRDLSIIFGYHHLELSQNIVFKYENMDFTRSVAALLISSEVYSMAQASMIHRFTDHILLKESILWFTSILRSRLPP